MWFDASTLWEFQNLFGRDRQTFNCNTLWEFQNLFGIDRQTFNCNTLWEFQNLFGIDRQTFNCNTLWEFENLFGIHHSRISQCDPWYINEKVKHPTSISSFSGSIGQGGHYVSSKNVTMNTNLYIKILNGYLFCFLSYFILAVPMHKCVGKHLCMSYTFPIAILNAHEMWYCVWGRIAL